MRRAVLAILLLLPALCFGQADDQQVWKEFLAWFKTRPVMEMPPAAMKAYAAGLEARGVCDTEIRRRVALVQKLAATNQREIAAAHFDRVFASPERIFVTDPSAFIVRMTQGLKPGKALDVGMGQGRNAVYLASKGWDVTGYDISERALAESSANAATAGVRINAVQKAHEDFDFGKEQWNLIVMVYSFASMSDTAFLKRAKESVKPGGMILVEQFNAPPSSSGSKGPANALFQSFADLRVVCYEDLPGVSDWGKMDARIGRLAAVKE